MPRSAYSTPILSTRRLEFDAQRLECDRLRTGSVGGELAQDECERCRRDVLEGVQGLPFPVHRHHLLPSAGRRDYIAI